MDSIKYITSREFFKKLCALEFIDEIFLYGSRARGDEMGRADFDIAIFCPNASDDDWEKVRDLLENPDTLYKIDFVRFDRLDKTSSLKKNIERDKKNIFKRA